MKYLFISLLACMVMGCGDKTPPMEFTPFKIHAVHNACINVWAIKTDYHFPYCNADTGYWGNYRNPSGWASNCTPAAEGDSVDWADLGHEFQFKDSATAMRSYNDFVYRRNRPQQIADSIFKCQHTYQ